MFGHVGFNVSFRESNFTDTWWNNRARMMSDEKQSRSSLRKAIEEARQRGDKETALRLGAVLKALEDVDATVTAAPAAVIATL